MNKATLCLWYEGDAENTMGRQIVAIMAGLLFWAAIASLLILVLRIIWPAYEAAHPTRDFTFPMLLVRLAIGAVATLGTGAMVQRMAGPNRWTVLIYGALLLMCSTFVHLREPTWSTYPVWYHVVFLGYLIPLTLIGGLAKRR